MKCRAMNVFIYDIASDSVGCLGRTKQSVSRMSLLAPSRVVAVMRSLSTFSVSNMENFLKTD